MLSSQTGRNSVEVTVPRSSWPASGQNTMRDFELGKSRSVAALRPWENKDAVNKQDGFKAFSAPYPKESQLPRTSFMPTPDKKLGMKARSTFFNVGPGTSKKSAVPFFDLNSHVQNAHYRARNDGGGPTIYAGSGITHAIPMSHKREYIP